ncbi:hypothetical protein GGE46_001792 [Rhizobium etli]|uniref:Uncharacterized protein n=1 Tax=Rhizobium etli TaxID=29449 RepID=A0A7W6V9C1_RHIET|nr:hypothetical protein [Rhizobium etli]MBB4534582.1 hypothetical protein [Rhizobium etli]
MSASALAALRCASKAITDLDENPPVRVAVTVNKEHTPHLPLLGRTARIIQLNSSVETFKLAA